MELLNSGRSRKCCVKTCSNKFAKSHRFPKNEPEIFKEWIRRTKPKGWEYLSVEEIYWKFNVCHDHFHPDSHCHSHRGLKRTAVPTLNLSDFIPENNDKEPLDVPEHFGNNISNLQPFLRNKKFHSQEVSLNNLKANKQVEVIIDEEIEHGSDNLRSNEDTVKLFSDGEIEQADNVVKPVISHNHDHTYTVNRNIQKSNNDEISKFFGSPVSEEIISIRDNKVFKKSMNNENVKSVFLNNDNNTTINNKRFTNINKIKSDQKIEKISNNKNDPIVFEETDHSSTNNLYRRLNIMLNPSPVKKIAGVQEMTTKNTQPSSSKPKVIKTTVIHPATQKHIVKFSSQKCYMVDETSVIYKEIILPHLADEQLHLQWVYNILERKSETERIVFEDKDPINGFVMVPDLKWNGEIDTLYLLAIVNRRDIKSLRDLTDKHLPLLRNIKEKGAEAIKVKYSLNSSRLRIYLHYQPSFYHLHVHFCFLQHEAPGILTEKAHLLSSVISNIELIPDYYQKVTIPFVVRENDKLYKKLENKGVLISC